MFTLRALQKKRKKKSSPSLFSSARLIYTSLLYTGPPFLMRNTGTADLRGPAPYHQRHFEAHMDEFKHEPPWLAFTESQDIYLYSPLRTRRPVQRNGFRRCVPTPLPVPPPHTSLTCICVFFFSPTRYLSPSPCLALRHCKVIELCVCEMSPRV